MTPQMHLTGIVLSFGEETNYDAIKEALLRAFSLGAEYGLQRAADEIEMAVASASVGEAEGK